MTIAHKVQIHPRRAASHHLYLDDIEYVIRIFNEASDRSPCECPD
jgi:hypothetical protein